MTTSSELAETLRERIVKEIRVSMKKQSHRRRLRALRGLLSEIVTEEKRGDRGGSLLNYEEVLAVIASEKKKYEEAVVFAQQARRLDLENENREYIRVLLEYLPPELSDAEVDHMIRTIILQLNVTDIMSLGSVMRVLRPMINQGRYDGKKASERVRVLLTSLSEGKVWTT